jgi:hypothetical protein
MKFYRFNVSGTKFYMSKANIEYDAPNIFTEKFQEEPKATRMAFDRNPEQFSIIHKYLQGYSILTEDMKLHEVQNLLYDAMYYKLPRLTTMLLNKKRGPLNPTTNQLEYLPLIDVSDDEEETQSIASLQDVYLEDTYSRDWEEDIENDHSDLANLYSMYNWYVPEGRMEKMKLL